MFSRQTVFVLGAGASHEVGLPIGDDLRGQIVNELTRDGHNSRFSSDLINSAVRNSWDKDAPLNYEFYFEDLAAAAARIRAGLPLALSIDSYLDAHRHDDKMVFMGKLAIAAIILKYERVCMLHGTTLTPDSGIQRTPLADPKLQGSWLVPLMRILTSGKSTNDLATLFDNVAFIVFNYDRCLEQFLVNAVLNYYHCSTEEAIDTVSRLAIVHPYGQVGSLPWQTGRVRAAFGDDAADIRAIAERIQTYTESADSGRISAVKEIVANAETLAFMGFGFLPQNMELLSVRDSLVRDIFATTFGISDSDVLVTRQEIADVVRSQEFKDGFENAGVLVEHELYVERGFCADLMKNHWLRLSR